jgi:hypothetical protein
MSIDELTRQMIIKAYAHYCAEHKMRPSTAAAERFAVTVTESGAKDYHGVPSAELVNVLADEFAAAQSSHESNAK